MPVANKPVLFCGIEAMAEAGVEEVAIIIAPETGAEIDKIVGDGSQFWVRITYIVQDEPAGLATGPLHGIRRNKLAASSEYSLAPDEEPNLAVVQKIIALTGASALQIAHVADRPGHDVPYSLSLTKIRALGWEPRVCFDARLEQTVHWYRENSWWWQPIRSGDYRSYFQRQYGHALLK